MRQVLKNKTTKYSEEQLHYMSVLRDVYKMKVDEFLRQEFDEKIRRDMSIIRQKHNFNKEEILPF